VQRRLRRLSRRPLQRREGTRLVFHSAWIGGGLPTNGTPTAVMADDYCDGGTGRNVCYIYILFCCTEYARLQCTLPVCPTGVVAAKPRVIIVVITTVYFILLRKLRACAQTHTHTIDLTILFLLLLYTCSTI